jgi:Leucine-rich repeat (LRR) protein
MNKRYTKFVCLLAILLITVCSHTAFTQQASERFSEEEIGEFKAEIGNLVSFLEYSFNMLGDPGTTARDKDVIINQSYAKVFLSQEVQVEDDLDDTRETLINKDVQAYLKDIDFFFRQVVFTLNVSNIDHQFKDNGDLYFIVTLTRTLSGLTVTGDSVFSNKERFIEVNYDENSRDLRIASIYTTKIDERDELFSWWNTMPGPWRGVLGSEALLFDTLSLSEFIYVDDSMGIAEYTGTIEVVIDTFLVYGADTLHISESDFIDGPVRDTVKLAKNTAYRLLQRIAAETSIDISGNLNINTLAPLSRMGDLISVNCANTLIDDLSPLRNLIRLESLNCSGTAVRSVAPLQYSVTLKNLDLSTTLVGDIRLLANLRGLEKLDFSNTPSDSIDMLSDMTKLNALRFRNTHVKELSPLRRLQELRTLDFSGSPVSDISALPGPGKLERLFMSNTNVKDLSPLSGLVNLQIIRIDSTNVDDLSPLSGLPRLEAIYCDNTGITGQKAKQFLLDNPNTLVIYETMTLASWWISLPQEWQNIFRSLAMLDPVPATEQLHKAVKLKQIDISGKATINTLSPLVMLKDLESLNCSGSGIENLWPLSGLTNLRVLDCSHTGVESCDPLRDLEKLEKLNISHTGISDIHCLSAIMGLKELDISGTQVSAIAVFTGKGPGLVYADNSLVGLAEVIACKKGNPGGLVVYQTEALQAWWNGLPESWREALAAAADVSRSPGKEDLQRIADTEDIDLGSRKNLGGLEPLGKLYRLRSLKMNDTQLPDLRPLSAVFSLETLDASNNPITNIAPLAGLHGLKHLDLRNTPIDDLEHLSGLTRLEVLDLSGTPVKKLNELSSLLSLREISFFNTAVKSLDPLEDLPALKMVRCYNTKLNERKVKKFIERKPGCEVIFY